MLRVVNSVLVAVIVHSICIPNSCIFHIAKTGLLRCCLYTRGELHTHKGGTTHTRGDPHTEGGPHTHNKNPHTQGGPTHHTHRGDPHTQGGPTHTRETPHTREQPHTPGRTPHTPGRTPHTQEGTTHTDTQGQSHGANLAMWSYSSCAKLYQKVQCSHCLLYWNQGIVYCTCGQCLIDSESRRKFNKPRLDALSIPHYVIKKGRSHGTRHGKTEEQKEYHQA